MTNQTLPYRELLDFGVGINRLNGKICGFPFHDADVTAVEGGAGSRVSAEFNQVNSYVSLATSLGIDAAASARLGMFGADASFQFAESLSINSYSMYVYLRVTVNLAFKQTRRLQYVPEALALLKAGRTADMRAAYGDWFVRGVSTGGQFMSIIEIKTKDEESRREISGSLQGSYGIAASIESHAKSTYQQAVIGHETHAIYDIVGGPSELPREPEDVFDAAQTWISAITAPQSQLAVPYRVGYVGLDTVPSEFSPTWIELEMAEEFLTDIASERLQTRRRRNDLQYILLNQNEFLWDGRQDLWTSSLEQSVAALESNLQLISKAASAQVRDVSTRPVLERFEVPSYEVPLRVERLGNTTPAVDSKVEPGWKLDPKTIRNLNVRAINPRFNEALLQHVTQTKEPAVKTIRHLGKRTS